MTQLDVAKNIFTETLLKAYVFFTLLLLIFTKNLLDYQEIK